MNNVALIGRLVRDPELRYTISGTPVTKFSIAVDRGYSRDKKIELTEKGEVTADFINIVVWGKSAENVANYTTKGKLIAIQGRLQSGSYDDKDGKKVYTTDVVANNIEFLEWGDKADYQAPEGFHPVDDDIPF